MAEGPTAMFGAGRHAVFESLVRAYATDLYRCALWLARDPTLAEDLVQETYARAWKSLASLRDADAAKAWLFTILRREFARHRGQRDEAIALDDDEWERLPGPAHATEVTDAVGRLPEGYRLPLLLQVLGGFSAEEIGGIMACSAEAALQRVSRARRTLRQWLGGAEYKQGYGK